MKKLFAMLAVLALILCGCGKDNSAEWNECRLEEGSPDVYVFQKYGLYGLADAKKRELTDAKFSSIEAFSGDYAVASYVDYSETPTDISGFDEYPTVYGLIDRKGKTAVDFDYEHIFLSTGGYYLVEKDDLWGMMAADGSYILEPQYAEIDVDKIDPFWGHFARVRVDEGDGVHETKTIRYGLVNDLGETVIPVEYDELTATSENGETIVTTTLKGEIAQYRLDNRQAVRLEGENLRNPERYLGEKVCDAPEIYIYEVNDLKGLITAAGTPITEPVFSSINTFRGKYAVAGKFDYDSTPEDYSGVAEYPQRYGIIDTQGNTVVDFTYEREPSLSDDGEIIRYSEVNSWGSWIKGYKTIDGEVIVEPKYETATDFIDGYALVAEFEADPGTEDDMSGPSGEYYYGVIGTDGEPIIPLDYEEGEYDESDGTYILERNNNTYYYRIENGVAEEIVSVGDSFSLEDYYPFTGSKVARLEVEPTLAKRASAEHGHPRLDGATALFPVYSAVVEAVYPDGTHYSSDDWVSDASLIACTKTNRAYERLVEGECDIIFVAEPSDAQVKYAQDHGVEFELTPFGREAFVFIVNQKNPMNDISIDQIRSIYSGEITAWDDLGIENLGEIVAYQRPKNSGSQTALEKLMGDVPIMEAPSEYVEDFMGEVLDVIEYRNLPNAIGYTFRFFCTDMARSGVKLLSIDGVAPTVENIRDESYPICSTLYMVSRKGEPNPNVQALIDWVLSDQGRELIEKSGYVALG